MKQEVFKIVALLLLADLTVWIFLLDTGGQKNKIYFLDVGEGDSELIFLEDGTRILIDTGMDQKSARKIGGIIPSSDKYIDLVLITHNEKDHAGGLSEVADNFRIGTILFNGKKSPGEDGEIEKVSKENGIPLFWLGRGDKINISGSILKILSPDAALLGSQNENDASIVFLFRSKAGEALFMADAGTNVEKILDKEDIRDAEILKVGHHGSKNSTSPDFLEKANPRIAIIEVGEGNRYKHPAEETIERLEKVGARIFRTDTNGTIEVELGDQELRVYTDR